MATALTTTTPVSLAAAKIQTAVASFLASKEKLVRLTYSSDLVVQTKAQQLLLQQNSLESQLPAALAQVEEMKGGAYSIGGLAQIAQFGAAMTSHTRDVDGLVKQAGGLPDEPFFQKYGWWILGIGGLLALKFVFGGRRSSVK